MTPQSDCFLNGMVFSIYDDFGKNVYKSNNVKDCCDGKFKGKSYQDIISGSSRISKMGER